MVQAPISTLLSHGFRASPADPSLFHYAKDKITIFALVYVDDIILTGINTSIIQQSFQKEFLSKDLGELEYFLGMKAMDKLFCF